MPSTDERDPEVIMPRHQVDELNVNYYAFGVSDLGSRRIDCIVQTLTTACTSSQQEP